LLLLISRGYSGSFISSLFVNKSNIPDRFDVHGFPDWFDKFIIDISNAQRGTMIFSHFMTPHAPYKLTTDCRVNNLPIDAGYYLGGERYNGDQNKIDIARKKFHNEYYMQSTCVLNKIEELLKKINQLRQFDDAIIIIHGDHGSRISIGNHIEDYKQRDFIDNYATFYAIRSPNIQAGYDCRLISLPRLFSHHMRKNKEMVDLENNPQSIYAASKDDPKIFVESNMPDFPCVNGL